LCTTVAFLSDHSSASPWRSRYQVEIVLFNHMIQGLLWLLSALPQDAMHMPHAFSAQYLQIWSDVVNKKTLSPMTLTLDGRYMPPLLTYLSAGSQNRDGWSIIMVLLTRQWDPMQVHSLILSLVTNQIWGDIWAGRPVWTLDWQEICNIYRYESHHFSNHFNDPSALTMRLVS
jgi:hypothetical protein